MSERRIVVTGMGTVNPIGTNVEEYWKNLLAGTSGVDTMQVNIDLATIDLTSQIAGEIKEFDDTRCSSDPKLVRRMDRFIKLGTYAAREAVETAGLTSLEGYDPTRFGVVIGSGIGGLMTLEREHSVLIERGARKVSPFLIPMLITNIAAGIVAMEYGYEGPNFSISTACATANHAFGEASSIIRRGEADVMIAGGSEAAITPVGVSGFCSMRALSTRNDEPTKASRPFDKGRDGFVIGEGAGILVLEELEHAKKRGATIFAEVIGMGMTADAYHLTQPKADGSGAAKSMKAALANAGINPEDVQYVNAHGTSTPLGDIGETKAIKTAFGDAAKQLKVSSTKSMTGHLLGAAGGAEAIACIKTLQDQVIHPTINLEEQDPECDLDYVPNTAQEASVTHALSNSFGFGGHNSTVVFKKFS